MNAMRTHVAGIDVHKDILVITALIGRLDEKPKSHRFDCSTMTEDIESCAKKLLALDVREVAMESTGIYWKPVYRVLARMGFIVTLGNAQHIKNVPGRKTDVSDSHWIAMLHRCGLIRASFIPEEEFQQLRALTRHRQNLIGDLSRVKNRIQKVLEDGNIKLGSVLSDVFGVGALAVLRAIAQGVTDAVALSALIRTRVRASPEQLRKALTNSLSEVHCFEILDYLEQLDHLNARILRIEHKIEQRTCSHSDLIEHLDEVPGVDRLSAQVILAEATTHMEVFADDRKFAAWAGLAPGNKQSAGKRKRAKVRHGNPTLKRTLIQAAKSAVKKNGSFYQAKYTKLAFRLGSKNKAIVAIANRMARVVYHLIKDPRQRYSDLGHLRVESLKHQIKRKLGQLRALGLNVIYDEASASVQVLRPANVG